MSYRPRPNDHLVEPMVSALTGADESTPLRAPRRAWIGVALLGVVGIGTLFVAVFDGL